MTTLDIAGSSRPAETPLPSAADPHHERRWLILGLLGIAQLMVVLDATIVNIALPTAQADLGFGDSGRTWVVTAYALTFGTLLLLGGKLSDLLGRKVTFQAGLAGFAVASAVGGLAQDYATLVGARAAQGVFGALLAPAALSLLSTTFTDPKERGKAFGIYGAIAGSGAATGLLLGGVLTSYASWRWCLLVNLFFAGVALIGAALLLSGQRPAVRPRLDVRGTLVVTAGLFGVVFGLARAETDGWTDPLTLVLLVAGVALVAGFVALQARTVEPLLPLRVVLDRNRGGAYLAVFISGVGMFGVFLFLTYFLQGLRGFTPVRTGAAFLPMVVMIASTATIGGAKLLPRTGPRPLVPVGMLLAATGMVFFSQLTVDSTYVTHVLPGLLVTGVGFGLIFAPSMQSATSGVVASDAGVASAMVNVGQQVGGSIGVALLSAIAADAASGFVPVAGVSGQAAAALATMAGYQTAFAWAAGIFLLGALTTFLTFRPGRLAGAPDGAVVVGH